VRQEPLEPVRECRLLKDIVLAPPDDHAWKSARCQLVFEGKEGAAHRGRNAAGYAVSEIPRLRAAPIMPASAIIISTLTKPPAKAIAPPATPPLPPRKVPALTTPEPCGQRRGNRLMLPQSV
jgi:hypothetical protein